MNQDYINFIKETISRYFKIDLGTKNKYLIKDIIPFDYQTLVIHCYTIKFSQEKISELKYPARFTHELNLIFETDAELIFEQKITNIIFKKRKKFTLNVNCVFNPDTELFSFCFFDNNQVILNQYYDLVYDKYKDLKIGSLVDDDYKINGKSPVEIFTRVARNNNKIKDTFYVVNNLGRITQDTRFYVTNLLLIRPYVTDFLADEFDMDSKKYYRYFPTIYDKQYLLVAGILFELFYNYWDQIGDALAEVFLPNLLKNNIYFGTVLDQFPLPYTNSINYKWLSNFKAQEYTRLNNKRKNIVHYNSIESDYFEQYQDLIGDRKELENLQKEKEGLADYFLDQHNLALKGFEYLTDLINEK